MKKKKKKEKNKKLALDSRLLNALKNAGRPIFRREIFHLAHVRPEEKNEAKALLNQLVRAGNIVKLKGSRYGLLDMMTLIQGELRLHPDGFGFVIPEKEGQEDIFIPPSGIKGALHGDRVLARIDRVAKKGPEGTIVRILERGRDKIVGTLYRSKNIAIVTPEDERFGPEIIVPKKDVKGIKSGRAVVVKITFPDPEKVISPRPGPLRGRIVEVLGDPEDLNVQTKIVIRSHDLPYKFEDEALQEAEKLPKKIRPEDLKGRRDLRDLPFVTIDGDTAKDFDDAVYVKKHRSGYTLYVSIADVSHYVPIGSALDLEAYKRGTSVYFPNDVVPMFPEALSNWIASLVPYEDRLTVTAKISYDLKGNVKRCAFYPSVIRSSRRYTYTEVRDLLEQDSCPKELKWMEELCNILNKKG
ncbi:3'-to-5' exoribonuclease RNase R [Dissulfuribacter thermophilus]|uniref:3'-to-5' exoribonuclease RNase R n=1 Tax=Dissulfuribacter thermophilus TaxID=1156395 RepID=A0A1B9F4F6_9BACT|nr:ribonuclease R family protein [Dissulfuribacter thermophilus]OCC14818.1 3'-to-5' exoribonuclease RNase R [Dissulfuribacter thermophilus]